MIMTEKQRGLAGLMGNAQAPKEIIKPQKQRTGVTSIKVTDEARDKLKIYKGLSGANNISEAIENLLRDAAEGMNEHKKALLLELLKQKDLDL